MSVPPRKKWGDDDCGWNCPDENTDKCLTCNLNNSGKPGVPGPLPRRREKKKPVDIRAELKACIELSDKADQCYAEMEKALDELEIWCGLGAEHDGE